MEASLTAANQGVDVHLVEKTGVLGGLANQLNATWKGESIQDYLSELVGKITAHESITLYLDSQVKSTTGSMGNFVTSVAANSGKETLIDHGAAILTTGEWNLNPKNTAMVRMRMC